MGRRIKEEPAVHRACIATAAEQLFLEKGILATTMDDVAKAAKYSKATLYVYFRDKDEIVCVLALKSMKRLHERIVTGIRQCNDTMGRYKAICKELVRYQEECPLYFQLVLGEINVDFDAPGAFPIERDVFEVGEQIMTEIAAFLQKGIAEKVLRADILIPQTTFLFWASLSGIIVMGKKKQQYIQKTMGVTRQQFLDTGFDTLFRSICREGEII